MTDEHIPDSVKRAIEKANSIAYEHPEEPNYSNDTFRVEVDLDLKEEAQFSNNKAKPYSNFDQDVTANLCPVCNLPPKTVWSRIRFSCKNSHTWLLTKDNKPVLKE